MSMNLGVEDSDDSWKEQKSHPRNLIPALCEKWVTDTKGGIGIKYKDRIYITPSAEREENIQPEDLFVQTMEGEDISGPPPHKKLKKSQCTPLFMNAFTLRGAGAVIHTRSRAAVMATLTCDGKEFRVTHIDMIKGIRKNKSGGYYRYDEMLVVPIIDNAQDEKDLKLQMAEAMAEQPETCAVLVRRNGMYVWGNTWEQAKEMCERYDYLFDVAVRMLKIRIQPAQVPIDYQNGTDCNCECVML
ncbi:hypothetical protein ScPMuIL_016010 [Solemya velum]